MTECRNLFSCWYSDEHCLANILLQCRRSFDVLQADNYSLVTTRPINQPTVSYIFTTLTFKLTLNAILYIERIQNYHWILGRFLSSLFSFYLIYLFYTTAYAQNTNNHSLKRTILLYHYIDAFHTKRKKIHRQHKLNIRR